MLTRIQDNDMKLTLNQNDTQYQIQSYQPGEIIINDKPYHRSLIVSADRCIDSWPPQQFDALQLAHLETLLSLSPSVVILGTGEKQYFLPDAWQAIFFISPSWHRGHAFSNRLPYV